MSATLRDTRLGYLKLTPRQQEIALLVMRGLPNREIAKKFDITEQTVKDHIHDIFEKTGFKNRTELAIRLMGITPQDFME